MNTNYEIMPIIRSLCWIKLTEAQEKEFLHELFRVLKKWIVIENENKVNKFDTGCNDEFGNTYII